MIIGVALFNPNTQMVISLPKPNRHCDLFTEIAEATESRLKPDTGWQQGFIDDKGNFLDRRKAADHVLECKQELTAYARSEYKERKLEILFSEDVW